MSASVAKEPMSYKTYKQEDELVTKLRLIRRVKTDGWTQKDTACSFACHRNTVSKLLRQFTKQIPLADQIRLLNSSFEHESLCQLLSPLKDSSTKPHHHPKEATPAQTERVRFVFNDLKVKVGPERLQTMMSRKFMDSQDVVEQSLATIPLTKLKGIYKREQLHLTKVRATNGSYRPLYDYTQLACFEAMHFDTKHIRDKKALPPKVYQYFSDHSREIPNFEWNLIDAKSRVRFVAYSYDLNAEFGLRFLLFCLQFIRTMFPALLTKITIGYDNGVEFCSGSPLKLSDWNQLLSRLNAQAYAYNPYWDIRKNLIERSHRTDDEELFIPRGEYIKTESDFTREVTNYWQYWNFTRSHSGIGMYKRTPFEVLEQSGVTGAKQLLAFPILILDHSISELRRCTQILLCADEVKRTEEKTRKHVDQKKLIDIISKYGLEESNAQNVLTGYQLLYQKPFFRQAC